MEPLITLEDKDTGRGVLIPELARLYGGNLSFPPPPDDRPYVAVNFVRSIDGPITFAIPARESGGEISRKNSQDAFVMGMLRAVFGNMAEGANAVRLNPTHLWTPSYASPKHAALYEEQRRAMKAGSIYRTFFVSGSGSICPAVKKGMLPLPPQVPAVLKSPDTEVWVLTTESGKIVVHSEFPPEQFPALKGRVVAFGNGQNIDPVEALRFLRRELGVKYLLVEGGANFFGSLASKLLYDELFLTESDIITGNSDPDPRLTFAWGVRFAPENAPRHELISLKKDKADGSCVFERRRRAP